ncbi:MAG: exopolysaccharide biosynthesis protein [Clostridiales bacterium]|nr:MAG: exopolysaccharide biosynthesis protein [Clostridiales bacterium]
MSKNKKISSYRDFSAMNEDDQFAYVESFKTLRTNLMFGLAQREDKRILLTSSLPSEGKTITAFSLSIALAQTGVRVLIVDADMRSPKIHRYIRQKNDIGLSAVLSGTCEINSAVVPTEYENLWVMKAGQLPPNPAELLEGRYAEKMFLELQEKFDYVIYDTPPVNLVSDALSIAKKSTAILFVVREGSSTHEELKKSLRAIEQANLDLIGIVLNDSKIEKSSKYYKRKYGYGYGYGYGTRPRKEQNDEDDDDTISKNASGSLKNGKAK